MALSVVICENCEDEFKREKREINRSHRLGRKIYCSYSCANKIVAKTRVLSEKSKKANNERIKKLSGNRRDEYTPFRYFHHIIRNRKGRVVSVTLSDLVKQWKNQKSICPYTGVKLELPVSTEGFKEVTNKLTNASLDRIDSSKEYTPDNIQFISCLANYAKNDISHEDMIEFCKQITSKWRDS